MSSVSHAAHFDSRERQADAARLGMWIFLASEVLLFAGLFALYASYRALYPAEFARGVAGGEKVLGSANTAVLLVSSTLVASAVHFVREGKRRQAIALALSTIALGFVFLAIKGAEYTHHISAGETPGTRPFWTLYFVMTGLHAVHVMVGITVLGVLTARVAYSDLDLRAPHAFELGAVYWHLVDLIWIFLWPLFYLG